MLFLKKKKSFSNVGDFTRQVRIPFLLDSGPYDRLGSFLSKEDLHRGYCIIAHA